MNNTKIELIDLVVKLANAYLDLDNFINDNQNDSYVSKHYDVLKQGLKLITEGQQKIAVKVSSGNPRAKQNIEFLKDEHIYLVSGVETPSVTELLKIKFPDKYANIPTKILKEAAEHGTNVHKAIENFEEGIEQDLSIMQEIALDEYKKIKQKHKFIVSKTEQIVNYGKTYAGTYDILARLNNNKILIDVKTTAELDKEYLSWQLSLYNYAIKYEDRAYKLYCIWLPKNGVAEFVEIEEIPKQEIEEFLREVKNERKRVNK